MSDPREKAIREVVGLCNRIPGATTWNAAEFMYDKLTAALAVEQKREAAIRPVTDDQVNAYRQAFQTYLENSKKTFGPKVAHEATRAGIAAALSALEQRP